ncbi:MAG: hypothetical protein KDD56_01635 [Bdellovibrionales bacterium]|nr:hypothetical protein [Bdellovibrionales bacterium]
MAFGFVESGETRVTNFVEDIVESSSGYAKGPERALMSALLFDGIQACMMYLMSESEKTKSQYREAYCWVHTHGDEYIFSFESACEALGINPEYLRFGLINACNSTSDNWKRGRRNF